MRLPHAIKTAALRQGRRRGIALIIVMLVIVALSLLAAGFSYSMKVETRLAMNVEIQGDMIWAARSGVEYAAWVLSQEDLIRRGRRFHALSQFWAGGTGESNEEAFAGQTLDPIPLGDLEIGISILDLERRLNINTARPEMLERAVGLLGFDSLEAVTVAESIVAWRGSAPSLGLQGADEDYYARLPVPYEIKRGPMDDLSELLLIKGVSPEMYWGVSHPQELKRSRMTMHKLGIAPSGARLHPESGDGSPMGLRDLFTTQGVSRVNLNTAPVEVLQLLPGIDPATAENIVRFRAGQDHQDGTEDDTPFETVGELATLGTLPPQIIQSLNASSTTFSTMFEVRVMVRSGGYRRMYTAVLRAAGGRAVQAVTGHWDDEIAEPSGQPEPHTIN